MGRDDCLRPKQRHRGHFNPRAPCGARLYIEKQRSDCKVFQSTRPVWGATFYNSKKDTNITISIHAPRVGRDKRLSGFSTNHLLFHTRPVWGATQSWRVKMGTFTISIHAPRVGRDGTPKHKHKFTFLFQSTRPVWGATLHPRRRRCAGGISIHAPRVGRDKGGLGAVLVLVISIHAPRVGRDDAPRASDRCSYGFQSTRPVWGATANLTILPRQICTKGTKEFLLGRKTHGKKEK